MRLKFNSVRKWLSLALEGSLTLQVSGEILGGILRRPSNCDRVRKLGPWEVSELCPGRAVPCPHFSSDPRWDTKVEQGVPITGRCGDVPGIKGNVGLAVDTRKFPFPFAVDKWSLTKSLQQPGSPVDGGEQRPLLSHAWKAAEVRSTCWSTLRSGKSYPTPAHHNWRKILCLHKTTTNRKLLESTPHYKEGADQMPGRLMTQQTEDSAGEGGGGHPVWKARRIKKSDSRDKGIAANDK